MKECYNIIKDEEALHSFIEWLPELEMNEKYYVSLFARKKYCKELIHSNDKTQLKRFLSNKELLFNKIQQLEIPVGNYRLRSITAPQESLALYINPNPRCMKKATKMLGKKCWDLYFNNNFNIAQEALSCVQQSSSRKIWLDFDIDTKEIAGTKLNIPLALQSVFPTPLYSNYEIYKIVETRGGYHLLINTTLATMSIKNHNSNHLHKYDLNWYKKIISLFPIDVHGDTGDRLLPVPGCTQGGFVPKFI